MKISIFFRDPILECWFLGRVRQIWTYHTDAHKQDLILQLGAPVSFTERRFFTALDSSSDSVTTNLKESREGWTI